MPSSLFAASSVTLAWDPSTSTNIAGYKVYYGPASRTYTNTLTVGNATNTTISNLITGATYYFTATAYDTANLESDFSNEVGYTNTALAPPIIALTSPADNSAFTAPATISLAADVTANGHAITTVQFYNGATLLGEATTAPYALTWSSVAAGIYSLSAKALYDSGSIGCVRIGERDRRGCETRVWAHVRRGLGHLYRAVRGYQRDSLPVG